MINQLHEIDEKECKENYPYRIISCFSLVLSDHIEENVNTSSDEMESDQPTSTPSRSQTEDETIEIEGLSKIHPEESPNFPSFFLQAHPVTIVLIYVPVNVINLNLLLIMIIFSLNKL